MSTTTQASPAKIEADPEQEAPPSKDKTSDADTTAPVAPTEDPPPEADFA